MENYKIKVTIIPESFGRESSEPQRGSRRQVEGRPVDMDDWCMSGINLLLQSVLPQ